MDARAENTVKAAAELFDLICDRLKDSRGIHLETAITAAGYLAGASMLRATKVDFSKLTPGDAIFVDYVNETGPKVLDSLMDLCARNGVERATHIIDQVPQQHQPLKPYVELMGLFDEPFQEISRKCNLSGELQIPAAVRAIAQFICNGKAALVPAISFTIAFEAIVKGSKTVPPPLNCDVKK